MKPRNKQNGSLHLIVLIILFAGIMSVIIARYYTSASDVGSRHVDTSSYLSTIPSDVLEYQKIREIAFLHHGRSSISAVMIRKVDGLYVYELRYVDQASLRIDAQSGMKIETNEPILVSSTKTVLGKSSPRLGFEVAHRTAVDYRKGAQALAVEYLLRDDLASYSVYFEDDRRVDVDANSGAVVVYR